MSKKASLPLRIAPLQRVMAETITDPVEQTALDQIRKRQKPKPKRQQAKVNGVGAKAAGRSAGKQRG